MFVSHRGQVYDLTRTFAQAERAADWLAVTIIACRIGWIKNRDHVYAAAALAALIAGLCFAC